MTSPVRTERRGDVLVVVADNPPVNALSALVRRGLEAGVREGLEDPRVHAVVIRCDGRTFFAGADITEFGKPPVEPMLHVLVDVIEGADKPIVAAIHGTALGGGCEVALACHYRIAAPTAMIGTPEVKLGLLPGAGGTQRIPRLACIPLALRMTALAEPIGADAALAAGLIDRIASEAGLQADAISFARDIARTRPLPRASEKIAEPDPDAVTAFRAENAKRFRGFDAPGANIACVEKAADGSSFREGVAFERREFMKLLAGAQSAAQRHVFFAERKAARIDGLADDIRLRPIERVGVIGAGMMGGGIAMNFLSAGIPVTIVDTGREPLDRGIGAIRGNYDASAARGRLTHAQVARAMDGLSPTLDVAALAECDLIIEAVYEDMEVKKQIFARLDGVARRGAILASNTSYLDIDDIAGVTSRPGDVVGLHFFSPANVMRLLEVVRGAGSSPDVLATCMALAKRIKKIAVVAGVCHGFIGNRMLTPRQVQASALLLEGATPQQIDAVHVDFGMPMGPFQMTDLAGVDLGWHRDPARVETIREALAAEGRWGQKTGKGYYDYDAKRQPSPSARVAEIIEEFRSRSGVPKRDISQREIIERTLYPLVNEGVLILEEGVAQRASDIDVVWVHGYGWPAWRGGPMFWAETEGLARIVEGLDRHGFGVAPSLRARATEPAKPGVRA